MGITASHRPGFMPTAAAPTAPMPVHTAYAAPTSRCRCAERDQEPPEPAVPDTHDRETAERDERGRRIDPMSAEAFGPRPPTRTRPSPR